MDVLGKGVCFWPGISRVNLGLSSDPAAPTKEVTEMVGNYEIFPQKNIPAHQIDSHGGHAPTDR